MKKWNTLANGETLHDHIEAARKRYNQSHTPQYSISFEEEELIWAIQDWYSSMGEFTTDEYKMLYDEYNLAPSEVDNITKNED